MKKTKLLQVRLTEQEDQFIKLKVIEHNYKKKSDYIRDSVISPILHDQKRMRGMVYEVNKIGVNLNQVVRKMHAVGQIDTDLLSSIDCIFSQLNQILETYGKL